MILQYVAFTPTRALSKALMAGHLYLFAMAVAMQFQPSIDGASGKRADRRPQLYALGAACAFVLMYLFPFFEKGPAHPLPLLATVAAGVAFCGLAMRWRLRGEALAGSALWFCVLATTDLPRGSLFIIAGLANHHAGVRAIIAWPCTRAGGRPRASSSERPLSKAQPAQQEDFRYQGDH